MQIEEVPSLLSNQSITSSTWRFPFGVTQDASSHFWPPLSPFDRIIAVWTLRHRVGTASIRRLDYSWLKNGLLARASTDCRSQHTGDRCGHFLSTFFLHAPVRSALGETSDERAAECFLFHCIRSANRKKILMQNGRSKVTDMYWLSWLGASAKIPFYEADSSIWFRSHPSQTGFKIASGHLLEGPDEQSIDRVFSLPLTESENITKNRESTAQSNGWQPDEDLYRHINSSDPDWRP